MHRSVLGVIGIVTVAACEPVPSQTTTGIPDLPEQVIALAAPNQNLASARLLTDDGCYWYAHSNAVETTLLPLRTRDGRPICTRPQDAS